MGGDTLVVRLERWLKIVPLIVSAVSGVLALIPTTLSLFGPFDFAAEVFLVICAAGIMIFAIGLTRATHSSKTRAQVASNPIRLLGFTLIGATPILALLLWYNVLRLTRDQEEVVKKEVARGDAELYVLHDPSAALDHYRTALLIAPRRGSIRAKVEDAQERIRLKGE